MQGEDEIIEEDRLCHEADGDYTDRYLTKEREENYDGGLQDGAVPLVIPNEEIKEIFATTVIRWFDDDTKKWNRQTLFNAVRSGNREDLTRENECTSSADDQLS